MVHAAPQPRRGVRRARPARQLARVAVEPLAGSALTYTLEQPLDLYSLFVHCQFYYKLLIFIFTSKKLGHEDRYIIDSNVSI